MATTNETPTDDLTRLACLEQAVKVAHLNSGYASPADIIQMAKDFYAFVDGNTGVEITGDVGIGNE